MRTEDIDCGGDVWIYTPAEHKNAWRGHDRCIPLGPKAQSVLEPFMSESVGAYLFSPAAAELHRRRKMRAARKTRVQPSQQKRKAKKNPARPKRDQYDTDSYRRAIVYGIRKENRLRKESGEPEVPHWFPLQLRHSRATELNSLYGIEAAAVTLGHAHADVTKVYAERNLKLAIEIAGKVG